MSPLTVDQDELTPGHAELLEEEPEQEIRGSDRIPPRPPRREEPHGRGRPGRPPIPYWVSLLLAVVLIGAGLALSMLGSQALNRAIEGLKRGRE